MTAPMTDITIPPEALEAAALLLSSNKAVCAALMDGIDIVLEEAARVADEAGDCIDGKDIADAIRAMQSSPGSGS
jgi:hypothetical protein